MNSIQINISLIFTFFLIYNNYALSAEQDALKTAREKLNSAVTNVENTNSPIKATLVNAKNRIIPLESTFKNQLDECRKNKMETDKACFEGNNKGWNQFSSIMGSFVDVGSMAMSATCSKFANALKMGQAALLGLRGTCTFMKSGCVEKCELAETTFKKIKKIYEDVGVNVRDTPDTLATQPITIDNECGSHFVDSFIKENLMDKNNLSAQDQKEIDVGLSKCKNAFEEKHSKGTAQIGNEKLALHDLGSIEASLEFTPDADSPSSLKRVCVATQQEAMSKVTMNLGTLMMSLQKNQACAQELASFDTGLDLSDCNITGTCTPAAVPDECLDPKNKDAIYCKTPALAGTNTRGGGGGLGSTKPAAPDFSLNPKNFSDLDMNGLGSGGVDGASGVGNIGDTPGPRSAGVPGGGGGGGLSIPGGGGAPPRGGGGGRGVSSDGASGSASPSYAGSGGMGGGSGGKNEDLQQYLPGGAKDPNLAKLGGPEGITAAGGPTIFEKVTKGYKNNRSSLIPE